MKLTSGVVACVVLLRLRMVTVSKHVEDLEPRRPATIASIDARLSVWGQAARDAAGRRAEALVEGALLYVERVGRNAEVLRRSEQDAGTALLDTGYEALIELGACLLPAAVVQSCRLLWVDPDRLKERLEAALSPAVEAARTEVRRRQALYRRRARLWQHDQPRLNRLREEIEGIRVPRCSPAAPERIARGLLERHRADGHITDALAEGKTDGRLSIRPGTIQRWIAQLEDKIAEAGETVA